MLRTSIAIVYHINQDKRVMARVRAFIKQLEQDGMILPVNHEDIHTIGVKDAPKSPTP